MTEFKTNNIYLAAYLATIGFPLIDVTPHNETILHFVFGLSENILTAERMYMNGQALCNPVPYSENIKKLKTILYEYKLANADNTKRGGDDGTPDETKGARGILG